MKILFLHGWTSKPGGLKPTSLVQAGHTVLNPALPDEDFPAAVRIAQAAYDTHAPDVIVGSSRGGAVAMNVESGDTPLVLLCPAWKRWGTARTVKPETLILHSTSDEVIPFADSEELVRASALPSGALLVCGHDHRLADQESLRLMADACVRLVARRHNRRAWNRQVEQGNRWTVPVEANEITAARNGELQLLLTPSKFVPSSWLAGIAETDVLCLASGGGQQGPLLAAAGARVTVFDNSPQQLEQDRRIAQREGLELRTVVGDMADLSTFADESFDLIFHPCSNCFASAVRPVWRECYRVLRQDGTLLAGFANPIRYIFEDERMENGSLDVRYPIPYSDLACLPAADFQRICVDQGAPLEFGHSLDDQVGGQLESGFALIGFYEDRYPDLERSPLDRYLATFIATRAVKRRAAPA